MPTPGHGKATRRVARRKTAYHHGSLRRALLDAALALIARHGVDGFTLRSAAREAGVTPGAPYHHFPDKDALLAVLAEEGFDLLRQRLEEAAVRNGPGTRAHEMAVEYVRFAADHPTEFRLMVGREAGRAMRGAASMRAARAAYQLMRDAVIAECPLTEDPRVAEVVVLASWSLVHGLAFLVVDGHLGSRKTWVDLEPIVRRTLLRGTDGAVTPRNHTPPLR